MFRNCLKLVYKFIQTGNNVDMIWILKDILLLGHSAIYCEVEGVGGADEDIDDEDKLLSHIVVHDLEMKAWNNRS